MSQIKNYYDEIIYPEIESVPLKYAICRRNRYMVDKADLLIAFVSRDWGGAYNTYAYAERRGKKIINLAEI